MIQYISQSISIGVLRVGTLSNSSILQIGAAGLIKGLSNNFNTGGYTGPAPLAGEVSNTTTTAIAGAAGPPSTAPLVPLPAI